MNSDMLAPLAIVGTVLVFWFGFRSVMLDAHRQRLFALRDRLFDAALRGEISFNDPAYMAGREWINAQIRFAHMVRLSSILTFWALRAFMPRPVHLAARQVSTKRAEIAQANPVVAQVLFEAEMSMVLCLLSSPLAIPLIALTIMTFGSIQVIRNVIKEASDDASFQESELALA